MTEQHPVASTDIQAAETQDSDHAELDRLVRGIGQVCISASMLEAELAFLALTLDDWKDEKYRAVLSNTGRALREYKALVPRLEAFGLGPDPRTLLDEATRLLHERHRVVHSVMMIEVKGANEPVYEAWHARSDETRDIDPAELYKLAEDLGLLFIEAHAFARGWEERAERDGWPVLPQAS
ncbi:MAG TPA: hypothetical protein VGI66_12585 [Streptosporangiaceae bacterium]|jgi:hypothetical protein